MRASRGMGDIAPSKMPKGVTKARRDNTDFTQFKKGGEVWDKPNPAKKHKKLNPAKKASAKTSAKACTPKPTGLCFLFESSVSGTG